MNRSPNQYGGKREGAGRKLGVPNKVKQELRDLARQYTPEALTATVKALRRVAMILSDKKAPAHVQVAASSAVGQLANILFDRGHGKPTQFLEVKRTPFDDMSPDELRALETALATIADDAGGPPVGDPSPPVDGAPGGLPSLH